MSAPDPIAASTPEPLDPGVRSAPAVPADRSGKAPGDALEEPAVEPAGERTVGVGPHPRPWPDDDRLDPELLEAGDRRNVIDRYRYWRLDAIVADIDTRRHDLHVAVENWEHDFNIGTVVRNANAFAVAEVHIVGKKRWNRRGAMVTDRYQHIRHHSAVAEFVGWCREHDLVIVAVENTASAEPIEFVDLPRRAVMVFGQEGPGLSDEILAAADRVVAITQYGSTRSLNAGVASGIAMHCWIRRHVPR